MTAAEVIEDLRHALAAATGQGQTAVSIAGLEGYLLELEKRTSPGNAGQQARAAEPDRDLWKHQTSLQLTADIELFKSVIESGQTAVKSATLINGGAAAALLAFLGSKAAVAPGPAVASAMLVFVLGVGFAGCATGLRYLTQYVGMKVRELLVSGKTAKDVRAHQVTAAVLNYVAILFGAASFIAFLYGGLRAYWALR